MHVSPADLRAIRRDGVLLHFALLERIAYVIAEIPDSGSAGTFVEEWCEEPHWAFAISGDVEIDLGEERHPIAPRTAFHVPAGLRHRMLAAGRARLAGFSQVKPDVLTSDSALRRAGYELVSSPAPEALTTITVQRARPERAPAAGEIVARSRRMGDVLFSRVRLGRRSGYTSAHCDLPHWGLVTSGSLAVESEDDVEVLTAGDAFYCPPGPPGHRYQAAEPAVIVDFTPISALDGDVRIVEWRRASVASALRDAGAPPRLETAALV